MRGSFKQKVLSAAEKIPAGRVASYGYLARRAGNPEAARAVGALMKKNGNPCVPCHRVLNSDGKLGGFNKGAKIKEKLLKKEGVAVKAGKVSRQYFIN